MTPRNCAIVTLRDGVEATFYNSDADEFTRGELTVTDRRTKCERIFYDGHWSSVIVYDRFGNYLYIIDKHPQPVVFVTIPPAA